MDVVYILRSGGEDYKEFRYSLRSLENIKGINNVFVIGGKPDWCTNVIHIPFDDILRDKYENVRQKYMLITNNKEISEEFIFMNDDFYILEPQEIKTYKLCTLEEQVMYLDNKRIESEYGKTIKELFEKYPLGDSFEAHTPIKYTKANLKLLYEKFGYIKGLRTVYCNEFGVKGTKMTTESYIEDYTGKIKDCKVYEDQTPKVTKKQKLLSSSDNVGEKFFSFLEERFPNRSKYELIPTVELLSELISNFKGNLILRGKPNIVINRNGKKYIADDQGIITAETIDELEIFVSYGFNLK